MSNSDDATAAARRQEVRIAKGYSLEDLAVATGLTVAEITATEEPEGSTPKRHVARIENVLGFS
ncbi:helix-turn-helix domain-containing protein [Rhizobium sp. GCM10022189]|uniref:helix-turn-helix domain-containing protein n=1 Tax=Rhizobium sp. GCM10022189 TaxID=3252654 RepID=UPI0036090E70